MTECDRRHLDPAHGYSAPPFDKCSRCKRVICYNCVGENLPNGKVLCIDCAGLTVAGVHPPAPPVYHHTAPVVHSFPVASSPTNIRVITHRSAGAATGVVNILSRTLYAMGAPFRARNRRIEDDSRLGLDVTFTPFRERAWFIAAVVGVLVVVAIGAIVYAEVAAIPRSRVLLSIVAACTCWGVSAVYLQYFFDNPLGRTTSRILAYIIAFFVAVMLGSWLINQAWLDKIVGFLG